MYVCCSEYNVVSNECNEPTSALRNLSVRTHGGEGMYIESFCFRAQLGFRNCDDICMCVVNKKLSSPVYVDLQYDEIHVTFTAGSVSVCCVCSHVVVFGLSVGGVCEMCMCLAPGGVAGERGGGECMRRLGLGSTSPVETGGVCLCLGCGGVGGVGVEWVGSGGVLLSLCEL